MSDYTTSPKTSNPEPTAPQGTQPEVKISTSAATGNGASVWRSVSVPEPKSPPKPTTTSTGFGFFSKEDMKAGEKAAISTAFKKYVMSLCFRIALLFYLNQHPSLLFLSHSV